eukprot:41280-Eustigmatos_ZCMA.PRE.1
MDECKRRAEKGPEDAKWPQFDNSMGRKSENRGGEGGNMLVAVRDRCDHMGVIWSPPLSPPLFQRVGRGSINGILSGCKSGH